MDKMKYLGINITKDPKHFINNKIISLLANFKQKSRIWLICGRAVQLNQNAVDATAFVCVAQLSGMDIQKVVSKNRHDF